MSAQMLCELLWHRKRILSIHIHIHTASQKHNENAYKQIKHAIFYKNTNTQNPFEQNPLSASKRCDTKGWGIKGWMGGLRWIQCLWGHKDAGLNSHTHTHTHTHTFHTIWGRITFQKLSRAYFWAGHQIAVNSPSLTNMWEKANKDHVYVAKENGSFLSFHLLFFFYYIRSCENQFTGT